MTLKTGAPDLTGQQWDYIMLKQPSGLVVMVMHILFITSILISDGVVLPLPEAKKI